MAEMIRCAKCNACIQPQQQQCCCPTIYIGKNGNWWIGYTDLGVPATGNSGKDGISPHISTDTGTWWIGDVDTKIKAQGDSGEDGKSPYISLDNGNWFEWNGTEFIDTGIKAQGDKGDKGDKGDSGNAKLKGLHMQCNNNKKKVINEYETIPFDIVVFDNIGDEITYSDGYFNLSGPAIYKIDWQVVYDGTASSPTVNMVTYYNNSMMIPASNIGAEGQLCASVLLNCDDMGVLAVMNGNQSVSLADTVCQANITITKWDK